eukprot:scaffold3377_cov19-Tisochrysis_lutea.AAC.1
MSTHVYASNTDPCKILCMNSKGAVETPKNKRVQQLMLSSHTSGLEVKLCRGRHPQGRCRTRGAHPHPALNVPSIGSEASTLVNAKSQQRQTQGTRR